MRYLFWMAVLFGGAYWGYDYFFGTKSVPPEVAITATTAAVANVTSVAAATGAVAGAAAATGFWAMLWAGGWFLGEMSFLLWGLLGCFILVPLGIIAWLTELPEEEELTRGARIVISLVLFGVMLLLLSWGGISFGQTMNEHWVIAGFGLIGFVAAGVWWSMFKYDRFAAKCKEDITNLIEGFCKEQRLKIEEVAQETDGKLKFTLGKKHQAAWYVYFRDHRGGRIGSSGATADSPAILFRRNKERISLWILFWPVSMLRGLLEDILVEAFDALIRSLRGVYEAIAKRHAVEVVYTESPLATGEETPARPSEWDEHKRR
mgnify:CR=1 FL=1